MQRTFAGLVAVSVLNSLFAALSVGCGEGELPDVPSRLPPEGGPYRVAVAAQTGSVAGRCRLVGEANPARLRAWPAMGTEEGQDDESVAKGSEHALGGCIVSLAGIESGKDWPEVMRSDERSITLSVQPGRYEPHLGWVRVGTQLAVRSILPTSSTYVRVYDSRGTTLANFSISDGETISPGAAFLDHPGLVHVTEDARHAFNAWILVSSHPYVEITRADESAGRAAGAYRLDGLPVGDYEVVCRHEPMDRGVSLIEGRFAGYVTGPSIELRRRVRIRSGETVTADFELRAPAHPSEPESGK